MWLRAGAALTVAVLLAACGGSNKPATSTTSRSTSAISRTAFIVRGDAICKASKAALAPVLARESAALGASPPKLAAGAAALEAAAAIVRTGLARLEALPRPSTGEALLAQVYTDLAGEAGSLGAVARDVRADRAAAESPQSAKTDSFSTRYSSAAHRFGFKTCGAGTTSG